MKTINLSPSQYRVVRSSSAVQFQFQFQLAVRLEPLECRSSKLPFLLC